MAPRKKEAEEETVPFAEPKFIDEDVPLDPVIAEEERFGDSLEDAIIGEYEAGIPVPEDESAAEPEEVEDVDLTEEEETEEKPKSKKSKKSFGKSILRIALNSSTVR